MPIQPGTFKRLPPKEEIMKTIEEERKHLRDITSYMWYIVPIAERFGKSAYEVAAKSLSESGINVSGKQLIKLAEELNTPEGKARYAEQRRYHIFNHVTG